MRPSLPERIAVERLIGVVRSRQPGHARTVADALVAGGVIPEVTLDSPGALEAIAAAAERSLVGAGTVLSARAARDAVAAGAGFIVSPIVDAELVAACGDVPWLPGAYTPTEIATAWALGAAAVKVFPSWVGGPAYIKSVLGPLSHIPLVPSGGIGPDDAAAYLDAGAVAVGIGSWLTGHDDAQTIHDRAARLKGAIRAG